jgi:hypothetical protein
MFITGRRYEGKKGEKRKRATKKWEKMKILPHCGLNCPIISYGRTPQIPS